MSLSNESKTKKAFTKSKNVTFFINCSILSLGINFLPKGLYMKLCILITSLVFSIGAYASDSGPHTPRATSAQTPEAQQPLTPRTGRIMTQLYSQITEQDRNYLRDHSLLMHPEGSRMHTDIRYVIIESDRFEKYRAEKTEIVNQAEDNPYHPTLFAALSAMFPAPASAINAYPVFPRVPVASLASRSLVPTSFDNKENLL